MKLKILAIVVLGAVGVGAAFVALGGHARECRGDVRVS